MTAMASKKLNDHTNRPRIVQLLLQHLLLISTIGAVLLGLVIGLVARELEPNVTAIHLVGFPGEMLMRMLKFVIIPLIISSLITGVAHLDVRQAGRMSVLALLYYLCTTVIAIITGIILVMAIHPGNPDKHSQKNVEKEAVTTLDTLLDLLRNMVPDNLVQSTMQVAQTKLVGKPKGAGNLTDNDCSVNANLTNCTMELNYVTSYKNSMNILGLIVACILFGAILGQLGSRAKTMVDFFAILDLISMRIVGMIMWYSPIGIMSLIAAKIMAVKDIVEMMQSMGMFTLTVLTGIFFHALVTLPLIYFVLVRRNPFTFIRGMAQALAVAFGTASSAATLPLSFRCLEQNLGIDRRITRFVLPVGATINMDGTALYEAMAVIFIAQMSNVQLSVGQVIIVSLTSTLASIGAAAIPGGALVTILMVLTAIGLPADYSMVFAVDWFLDRFRTTTNVLGDAFGAAIVHHYVHKDLPPPSLQELLDEQLEMGEEGAEQSSSAADEHQMENGHLLPQKDSSESGGEMQTQEENSASAKLLRTAEEG